MCRWDEVVFVFKSHSPRAAGTGSTFPVRKTKWTLAFTGRCAEALRVFFILFFLFAFSPHGRAEASTHVFDADTDRNVKAAAVCHLNNNGSVQLRKFLGFARGFKMTAFALQNLHRPVWVSAPTCR